MSRIGDYIIEQQERTAIIRELPPYDLYVSDDLQIELDDIFSAYEEYCNEKTSTG